MTLNPVVWKAAELSDLPTLKGKHQKPVWLQPNWIKLFMHFGWFSCFILVFFFFFLVVLVYIIQCKMVWGFSCDFFHKIGFFPIRICLVWPIIHILIPLLRTYCHKFNVLFDPFLKEWITRKGNYLGINRSCTKDQGDVHCPMLKTETSHIASLSDMSYSDNVSIILVDMVLFLIDTIR